MPVAENGWTTVDVAAQLLGSGCDRRDDRNSAKRNAARGGGRDPAEPRICAVLPNTCKTAPRGDASQKSTS